MGTMTPKRIAALPIDPQRGVPVPWFVAWIDGKPDFRVIGKGKIAQAFNQSLCWICGHELGRNGTFVIGPMCAVNRTSSEPPNHRDCAIFAAETCPFLTKPHMRRREANLPEAATPAAGLAITRNPGVTLLWSTRVWKPFQAPGGVLFEIGDPSETLWYCEGRAATRAEVEHSTVTGLPLLRVEAEKDGPGALELLAAMAEKARTYWPAT